MDKTSYWEIRAMKEAPVVSGIRRFIYRVRRNQAVYLEPAESTESTIYFYLDAVTSPK
jgi:hypothetical protein